MRWRGSASWREREPRRAALRWQTRAIESAWRRRRPREARVIALARAVRDSSVAARGPRGPRASPLADARGSELHARLRMPIRGVGAARGAGERIDHGGVALVRRVESGARGPQRGVGAQPGREALGDGGGELVGARQLERAGPARGDRGGLIERPGHAHPGPAAAIDPDRPGERALLVRGGRRERHADAQLEHRAGEPELPGLALDAAAADGQAGERAAQLERAGEPALELV